MPKAILSLLLIFLFSFFFGSKAQRFCNGVYCDANCQNCYPCQQEVNCMKANGCFCASKTIPGGLSVSQTPQFVFFTFDDAICSDNFLSPSMFDSLNFILQNSSIKDSMGCSPKLSAYFMGDGSDYNMAKFFDLTGSISLHTQTHTTNLNSQADVWLSEFQTELHDLALLSKVTHIRGARAPYLQTNDDYLTVLQQLGLKYDSSFVYGWSYTNSEQTKNYWPFTLDYGVPDQLMCIYFGNCPTQPHYGLWEFPLVAFENASLIMDYDISGGAVTLEAMKKSFLDSYNYNRVPRGYYIHWRYLTHNGDFDYLNVERVNFLLEFFSWLTTLPDIIFTTEDHVIEWIKNPVDKTLTKAMDIFQCPTLQPPLSPDSACPNGFTTCYFNSTPLTVCGRKCPQIPPGLAVNWTFLPSNLDYPRWKGNVTYTVDDSWDSGFCGSLYVEHSNSVSAQGYMLSEIHFDDVAQVTAFWGYSQKDMDLDNETSIFRQIGYWISIPPNIKTYIGGWCMQTVVTGAFAADPNWIDNNVRFGIDLYTNQLDCPLGGCAIFCGNGRCDDQTEEETSDNCPFDCLAL